MCYLLLVMSPLVDSQTKGAEDIKRVMANNVDINIGRVRSVHVVYL